MEAISAISKQKIENGQTVHNGKFVRNSGSYKIVDIMLAAGNHIAVSETGQVKGKKTILISGAGTAGLAAAFEAHAKGFEVVIAEKRDEFSRFNVINLNREAQVFLRKHGLLEEFETSVAARITDHQIVVFGEGCTKPFPPADVSRLQFEGFLPKDPAKFKDLFNEDGIYSVQIKDLQAFLAQKAAALGIKILGNAETILSQPVEREGLAKVEILQKTSPAPPLTITPDLIFIAEGARSQSAINLGMANEKNDTVDNACTNENWVFGNLNYHGSKTFVLSMIITAQKTLQIANVIFNANSKVVNVAVTSGKNMSEKAIRNLILAAAQKAFDYIGIADAPDIINVVKTPVQVANRIASLCSEGNVFRIGDAAGHSSPLAGLGGTLGLTLVPCTVEQLLEDYQYNLDNIHSNFKTFTQAYVNKWIDKSLSVKKIILGMLEQEQPSAAKHANAAHAEGGINAT